MFYKIECFIWVPNETLNILDTVSKVTNVVKKGGGYKIVPKYHT